MSEAAIPEDDFMALVSAIQGRDSSLSPLSAALTAAVFLDIAKDSRTFSRLLGVEHALVLREINFVGGSDAPLEIVSREARTQRTYFRLSMKGARFMEFFLDLGTDLSK